jgi:hypothetical protein
MALYKTKIAEGKECVPSLNDGLAGVIPFEYTTSASLAAGDIIDLGPIEPGVKPLDVMLISDDLDTNGTPTITLSVGILNAAKDDLDGTAWIVASTVGQAGGVARATTNTCYNAGSSTSERRLGIKVVAGAATGTGAGEKIAVLLTAKG